ncbi:cytochrome P450 6k1-like [Diabrotica virgifera virgifera]|uniref:Cytochrome P450 6k1-like n=2 Tax=Diabrotica virgifera virgifera TaxID=50390 RepID=A0ABM5KYQ3_DIAVI|nr:cytochrome P450 6k1-like [Diabrotica virgifera virgifera]XP_050515320.1 cytochrome P450 6k1-like [Diabrotica virgifera virgifera]
MLLTSSWIVDTIILTVTLSLLVYKYLTRHFDYWRKRKVTHEKPMLLFGNFYEVFTFKTTIQEHIKKIYDRIDAPYFGIHILDEPILVLKDPKLVKDVLIKDSAVFANRRPATPTHPLMKHALFFLNYPHWKPLRAKITPVFTSAMLKNAHNQYLTDIGQSMTKFLNKNKETIDSRRIGEYFASEMIFKYFFGANANCFEDIPSVFEPYVKKMGEFSVRNAVIQNLYFIKPSWVTFLKLDFISESIMTFFERVFKEGMINRKSYDGKPQTFVDMANKAVRETESGKEDTLDFNMSISTAIFFLIAGRDTLNTLIAFTLYEIAMHEDIQDKLREAIQENVEKYGGITYEGVHDNKYLDMCIKESMRKYPPIPFLDRMPLSDYTLDGTDLVVKKDMTVIIPFFALHRDENLFPNSDGYDPERFREEIQSEGLFYLPFGAGPRACIGKRLGLLGLLVSLSYIVLNFKVEKCPETPSKIEFEPKSFPLVSKQGLPLRITPIENK